jgi:F420-non-reducing hydrogenase iron-sulfur subunit
MTPYFRVVRTMCSGRIEPEFVLSAFRKGADGVLITGCHPGDCHYMTGNYKALRRYYMVRILLHELGIDERRFKLEWISAGEGGKFQHVINDFVKEIADLGPVGVVSNHH